MTAVDRNRGDDALADVALAPLTVGRPEPEVLVAAAAAAGFGMVGLTLHPPDGEPPAAPTA